MGYLHAARLRTGIRLALWLSAGLGACDKQASEQYLGEPLLQLQGQATIAVDTGGEAVTPALCFSKGAPMRMPASFAKLPAEVRADFDGSYQVSKQIEALAGDAGLWLPAGQNEIVEVETVGSFPAEFNVTAYLPPSAELVQPLFEGEPRVAEGRLCAVREEHPHIVHQRTVLGSSYPGDESEGPLIQYSVWLDGDTDAYYLETYRCPSATSPESDCDLTSEGDVAVRRNAYGTFVVAQSEATLVYLAEPASPGSYTAWKYGASNGLPAGFHLFGAPDLPTLNDHLENRSESCRHATGDALQWVRAELPERVNEFPLEGGIFVDNVRTDPFLRNAYERRVAELTMEHCEPFPYSTLAIDESISLRFDAELPPSLPRRPGSEQSPLKLFRF